jgi:hypothetical protein
MDADALQARIDEIERVLYAPANYTCNVMGSTAPDPQHQGRVAALAAELNRLRKRQVDEAAEKWGTLAPIGGHRLSTGYLEKPEPPEPDSWRDEGRDYEPLRRFAVDG